MPSPQQGWRAPNLHRVWRPIHSGELGQRQDIQLHIRTQVAGVLPLPAAPYRRVVRPAVRAAAGKLVASRLVLPQYAAATAMAAQDGVLAKPGTPVP